MAVASGEGPPHDLTPLGRRCGAWGCEAWGVGWENSGQWHENSGQWSVASESEGKELVVIEKRQNEANLPVVLIIDTL